MTEAAVVLLVYGVWLALLSCWHSGNVAGICNLVVPSVCIVVILKLAFCMFNQHNRQTTLLSLTLVGCLQCSLDGQCV